MKSFPSAGASASTAIGGALLCALLGIAALTLWLGEPLVLLSYDLLFLFRGVTVPAEAVVIYQDDESFSVLGQRSFLEWDRRLHARLLDRLTLDGARLVVFDIVFSDPGTPEGNAAFADAIRRNGKVVLAASTDHSARSQIEVKSTLLPLPEFLQAAAGWGVAEVETTLDPTAIARRYHAGNEHEPSLPWSAAIVAGAHLTNRTETAAPERWLNYYGPPLTLPHLRYIDVAEMAPGYFRDKLVFVGAKPKTLKARNEADQFATPYTRWAKSYMPGVEITATAVLNLWRHDWLERMSFPWEIGLVAAGGLLCGGSLARLRPGAALCLVPVFWLATAWLAIRCAREHVWFGWTAMAGAQVPLALAWSIRSQFLRLRVREQVLAETLARTTAAENKRPATDEDATTLIPDHTLVRCVGRGAYGQIWLARSTIAIYHAVKLVRRREFPSPEPYEREFSGVQKFMPISRGHPGLVHILHVGRNDGAGFFYYIMEAADPVSGAKDAVAALPSLRTDTPGPSAERRPSSSFDPATYEPRTLASELAHGRQLDAPGCIELGLALTAALSYLHRQQLIHRDIKPANIIYVDGAPKLADIGLVTEVRTSDQDVSYLGTEGYIPPEGPGTPSADLYALGKVMYEAVTGRDRRLFPEVATALFAEPETSHLRQLHRVIFRACETDPNDRFRSADALHQALLELSRSK